MDIVVTVCQATQVNKRQSFSQHTHKGEDLVLSPFLGRPSAGDIWLLLRWQVLEPAGMIRPWER